jgi:hypothetical protein
LIVGILASVTEILPIVFYLIFLKRNRGEGLWVIFLYCILSILTEVLFGITGWHVIFDIFIISQFTLCSLFFFLSLKEKKFKYIPVFGAVVFYAVTFSSFTKSGLGLLSAALASILLIPYCILLLYEQIKDPTTLFVYNNKKFWVIIAFLLYFSATLFLDVNYNSLSREQQSSYWFINNFFEILKNILFCVSFIMKKGPKNSYTLETLDN